jgi:hypothetical protein
MEALSFKQCYENEESQQCDFAEIQKYIETTCGKTLHNINDVLYRLCGSCKAEIIKDKDICDFVLSTSSHAPYILNIDMAENPQHIVIVDKPEYISSLMLVSETLVYTSSNINLISKQKQLK